MCLVDEMVTKRLKTLVNYGSGRDRYAVQSVMNKVVSEYDRFFAMVPVAMGDYMFCKMEPNTFLVIKRENHITHSLVGKIYLEDIDAESII